MPACSIILYIDGVRIIVEIISNKKLTPIIPIKSAAATVGIVSLIMPCKIGIKKIRQKIANIPVLMIGTNAEARITPYIFSLL